MSVITLVEFLLARIAEDEMVAKEVPGPSDEKGLSWWGEYGHLSVSPARVLAEVDAKVRITEECRGWLADRGDDYGARALAGMTLRLLALPYTDHPDYREEWRP